MSMNERISRREFLEQSGTMVGAVAAIPALLAATGPAEAAA